MKIVIVVEVIRGVVSVRAHARPRVDEVTEVINSEPLLIEGHLVAGVVVTAEQQHQAALTSDHKGLSRAAVTTVSFGEVELDLSEVVNFLRKNRRDR